MEKSEVTNIVKIEASSKTNEQRVPTGIEGFDGFVEGGFPRGSMILLVGSAGSGKTIFASQYLYHGLSKFNEPGIYFSMAENRSTFMKSMKRLGMDFEKYERNGKFKFLDMVTVTDKGIKNIVERALAEVDSLGAKRLVIDSFSALAQAFSEKIEARIFLHSVLGKMTKLTGTTTLLISERMVGLENRQGGMEEFVTDGVISLNSVTQKGWLIRTLQVIKLRGTKINTEEHCYGIDEHGIRTYPLPDIPPVKRVYSDKVHSGIEDLDKMLFGGMFKGSTTLVGGPSGTGKTTFALHFITEAASCGLKSLYVSFEEPGPQMARHAESFGWNMKEFMNKDLIRLVSYTPEPFSVEQQLDEVFNILKEFKPARLVIDPVMTLGRIMIRDRYLRYIRSLALYLKDQGITGLFTALVRSIMPLIGSGIASTVDNIIALNQVEIESSLRRSAVILKTRGSDHENKITEFEITSKGIVLKKKFLGTEQILGGTSRTSKPKISTDRSKPSRTC